MHTEPIRENHRVELKRELTAELDLEKEVVAFLNSHEGGFIYLGSAAEPMPTAMIERLFANRTRNSIGKIKAHRQTLSFEQLRIYYEEKRKPLGRQFKTNLELTTEDGALNYAAYLLADENGMSIKVAKYQGKNRVHLIESNEYGYCSLIKATKAVLDKLELENKTASTITAKERIDVRLWSPVALREAVINAIVHNDYSREAPPKFEIFADRIEITSACALPEGLTPAEFFEGYSIPRNKELMRVFKDLEMVEHLGSGLPRITEFYGPECFRFTENFLRITFAASRPVHEEEATEQETEQVTEQVRRLCVALGQEAKGTKELMQLLGLKHRPSYLEGYLNPALQQNFVEPTQPDSPRSPTQKYRLTAQGKALLK